jgi:Flp pilus assembly protein TadG
MKLPWRRKQVSRGQALVEFAMVLPILALLLVMAIDFGRVFYGWVALNNAARIGANYAATHPDAWTTPDSTKKADARAAFIQQIVNDSQAINCSPAPAAGNIGDPAFTAADGVTALTGTPPLGSQARVELSCTMSLITPLATNLLGGGVNLSAAATFPVRSGTIAGVEVGVVVPTSTATASASATSTASGTSTPAPTATPCPLPIANFVADPTKDKGPLFVTFTDTSQTFGCPVDGWTWEFGDGGTSTLQNPTHTYPAGSQKYDVKLTVFGPNGSVSLVKGSYVPVVGN